MTVNTETYMIFGYGFTTGIMVCILIHQILAFFSTKKENGVSASIPLEFQVNESTHQLTLLKTDVILAESKLGELDSRISRLEQHAKEQEQTNNCEIPLNVVPFSPKDR